MIARFNSLEGNIAIFSHGHFGRVLTARWIGLPVSQAQHFLLNTASLSILGSEHNLAEAPAIVLWNAVSNAIVDLASNLRLSEEEIRAKKRAIDRWENEGGEILTERQT